MVDGIIAIMVSKRKILKFAWTGFRTFLEKTRFWRFLANLIVFCIIFLFLQVFHIFLWMQTDGIPLIRHLYRNHLDFSQIINNFPHTKSANPAFIHSFPGILCVNLAFNPKSWTHKPDLPGQAYLATEFAPAKRQRGGCRVRLMTFDGFRFGFRKDRRRPEPG